MKKCPVCGAVINENNMNRCSRFPICTYVGKMETQEIHDINEYVVFDLETSGFSRKDDRIIEIGAVYVKNGVVVDRFSQLCSPGYKNGKKVLELAGAGDINSSNFALPSECILALSNYEIEDNIRDLFKSDNTSTKIYLTDYFYSRAAFTNSVF